MTRLAPTAALALLLALPLGACGDGTPRRDHKPTAARPAQPPAWARGTDAATAPIDPADPIVLTYQVVAPRDAEAMNAQMPISTEPLVAARPFKLDAALTPEAKAAATDCLTSAIYYEATSEGETGERAVAQVVLNRVRHPTFAKTVCGVVFQGSERVTGCQFTFTCDGALARLPNPAGWERARKYAEQALAGRVEKSVGLATHYHTRWVVPYWRSDLSKLAVIGAHIFYRWQGGFGLSRGGTPQTGEVLPMKLALTLPGFVRVPATLGGPPALAPLAADGAGTLPPLLSGASGGAPAVRLLADRGRTPPPAPPSGTGPKVKLPPPRDPLLRADDQPGKLDIDERKGELITR